MTMSRGADALLEQAHHRLARGLRPLVAGLVGRRRAGRAGQGEPDRLGDAGHGVGGELAAAGTGRRARRLLQRAQILLGDRARGVLADRLEHVLHGHVLAAEPAGQNAAAVHEDRGHVEPDHRHHQARQGLVAAGEADQGVVGVAAHGQLGRIRDHLARHQRALHALMAHGDAVGHRDRRELARRAAGLGDAALDRLRLTRERDVAWGGLVPGGDDPDERRRDVLRALAPSRSSTSDWAPDPGPRSHGGSAAWTCRRRCA